MIPGRKSDTLSQASRLPWQVGIITTLLEEKLRHRWSSDLTKLMCETRQARAGV